MPVLAVYGTLRRGEGNSDALLRGCRHLGVKRLKGFTLYDGGGFPYAVPDINGQITVDLFEVTPFHLERTDKLEGVPYHYRRIQTVGGFYIYVTTARRVGYLPKIASGDWKRRDEP